MKTLRFIYIIFFTTILTSSCEDFLDIQPVSQLPAEGYYESESDARGGVYGIYNAAQSAFNKNFAYWGEGRADNVYTIQSTDAYSLINNSMTPTLTSSDWTSLYTMISRANYAIKYIPGIFEDDDEESMQLLGQARALRALAYFYAVRVWGDVPLITEPYLSAEQDVFTAKTNQETVLDLVEEDLEYAAANCADNEGDDSKILIIKGAANAFLTQVYMWRHKYAEALVASQKVLDNDLYSLASLSDWSAIFMNGNSGESIFEIGYNSERTNQLRILYAQGSFAEFWPSETFMNSFESGDLRQTKIYNITEAEPKQIWKFFGEGFDDGSSDPSDNNIVLTRLSDIMLLRAEALNKQGDTDGALALLNTIRERAGLPALTVATANSMYGDLESAILHERDIELCYEGHRWFDLVRTGKAISTMQPLNGISNEGNLLWPISLSALNENPNLVQNTYYQ